MSPINYILKDGWLQLPNRSILPLNTLVKKGSCSSCSATRQDHRTVPHRLWINITVIYPKPEPTPAERRGAVQPVTSSDERETSSEEGSADTRAGSRGGIVDQGNASGSEDRSSGGGLDDAGRCPNVVALLSKQPGREPARWRTERIAWSYW